MGMKYSFEATLEFVRLELLDALKLVGNHSERLFSRRFDRRFDRRGYPRIHSQIPAPNSFSDHYSAPVPAANLRTCEPANLRTLGYTPEFHAATGLNRLEGTGSPVATVSGAAGPEGVKFSTP